MKKKTGSIKIGRDASTGKFIPVKKAVKNPRTTTVETIKKRGS
jgi:hypothetical protein